MERHPGLQPKTAEPELDEAARLRRERDLALTMSERLERMHRLCKQASQLRAERTRST